MEPKTFQDGAILMAEGQTEFDEIFIILSGEVSLSAKGVEVQRAGRAYVVGDRGVVFREQSVDVIAVGPVKTLLLSIHLLTDVFGDRLSGCLVKNRILSILGLHETFSRRHEDQRDLVANTLKIKELAPGQTISSAVDDMAICTILHGEVEVTQTAAASPRGRSSTRQC